MNVINSQKILLCRNNKEKSNLRIKNGTSGARPTRREIHKGIKRFKRKLKLKASYSIYTWFVRTWKATMQFPNPETGGNCTMQRPANKKRFARQETRYIIHTNWHMRVDLSIFYLLIPICAFLLAMLKW